ncbi:phospholipase D family protein [Pantoea sp. 18069]|uniref:phospholipase D family protein n=1 Tax=Pantoea sp. 18069 TaxID=2681415 RepID=UPI001358190A|nr:phospholipase D family protein [Pantoea sp. 18069]
MPLRLARKGWRLRWRLLLLAACGWLSACGLPPLDDRTTSTALAASDALQTRLGQALAPQTAAHPGLTGIYALSDPLEAFTTRALLMRAAQRTLDVQYYIWHDDTTSALLVQELLAAAGRGVRVRLLLDDVGTSGLDAQWSALDQHPRIEVRLFNPMAVRRPKALGYLTDFARANRRMHNKSLTADNQATVIGGRNIGDEYFGATEGVLFADLDVLAVGAIVPEVSHDFDRYWASDSSHPVAPLLSPHPAQRQRLDAKLAQAAASPATQQYQRAVVQAPFLQQLLQGVLPLEWAQVRMVSDDPAKGLGRALPAGLLLTQLAPIIGEPQRTLDLVSPYFVPTQAGVAAFAQLRQRGIAVRVLTNSLQATDVAVVHAGYARWRRALLAEGVELYEMRPGPDTASGEHGPGPFGSSGASLHAKTFAIDARRVFVGSFNFDPRSAHLNTELGFVIDSPRLASQVSQAFAQQIPQRSYRVRLDAQGQIEWHAGAGNPPPVYRTEPGSHWLERVWLRLLTWLPIEWLL